MKLGATHLQEQAGCGLPALKQPRLQLWCKRNCIVDQKLSPSGPKQTMRYARRANRGNLRALVPPGPSNTFLHKIEKCAHSRRYMPSRRVIGVKRIAFLRPMRKNLHECTAVQIGLKA